MGKYCIGIRKRCGNYLQASQLTLTRWFNRVKRLDQLIPGPEPAVQTVFLTKIMNSKLVDHEKKDEVLCAGKINIPAAFEYWFQ